MRSSLVLGCVLGSFVLFAAPDVSVAAKNMGGPAVADNVVANYSGLPKLTWEAAGTALTVQRAAAGSDSWSDLATVPAGTGEYVDESAKVSRAYRYRLVDESGAGAASDAFTVMRFLPAKNADAIFTDGSDGQSWAWGGKSAVLVFDGGLNQANYLDKGRSAEYRTPTYPIVGIDYGEPVYVAYCRAVPRYDSANREHRVNDMVVYGAQADWATTGQMVAGPLSNTVTAQDRTGFGWYGMPVGTETAYPCWYIQGIKEVNVTEVEFWGWTQADRDAASHIEVEFSIDRSDYEFSYAVITCDPSLDGMDVERRKQGGAEAWEKVGVVAEGTFTDRTVPYGGFQEYRLTSAAGESSAKSFLRMHRLSTENAAFFTDGAMDLGWCQPVSKAFDGDIGSFPDVNASRPKIGLDFTRPEVTVARVRLYPRSNTLYRFTGVALYGSALSASLEVSGGDLATRLTGETPNLDEPKWVELDVANPAPYRTYYLYKASGEFYGNVTECELYGWTLADEGAEMGLDFAIVPQNYDDFHPALSWNDISAGGVEVQRSESPDSGWTTLGRVAKGEEQQFVDTTARFGRPYYYRLAYDGKTGNVKSFRRLRRLNVTPEMVVANNHGAWNNSLPGWAFDGDLGTFPDLTRENGSYAKVGVDFGTDDNAVALVRFYPRHDWGGGIHLSSGAVLYGSNRPVQDELDYEHDNLATALTQPTTFVDDILEWQSREVSEPDYYRMYYYRGCYACNICEVQFFGWYRRDLIQPTVIILR